MSAGAEDDYRPRRVQKTRTKVIHMPRWGVERVILREITITLPHVELIDGPYQEPAVSPETTNGKGRP